MSEIATNNPAISDSSQSQTSVMRILSTLVRKEFRQTGFFSMGIMVAGIIIVIIGTQYSFWLHHRESLEFALGLSALAEVIPLLIVIACGSAVFSIEHENRSFQFLRALPIRSSLIFWTKIAPLVLLTTLSCLIFWPITYSLLKLGQGNRSEFLQGLPAYSIAMLEALLWSILFSLREKKVIHAIVKSSLGFVLVTNGVHWFAMTGVNDRSLDELFHWVIIGLRVGIGATLLVLIIRYNESWLQDPRVPVSDRLDDRRPIDSDNPKECPPWRRLAWLQFRADWRFLLFFCALNLTISVPIFPLGVITRTFVWGITIAMLGVVSANPGRRLSLLISSGYTPIKIWWVQSLIVFAVCAALTYVYFNCTYYNLMVPDDFLTFLVFFLPISFAAGQLTALFFKNVTSALVAASLSATISFSFLSVSWDMFKSQIPVFILLAAIPFALVVIFVRTRMTTGRLGKQFMYVAPVLFGLALVPFPILRVYEVPDADVSQILQSEFSTSPVSSPDMAEAREIGDQFRLMNDKEMRAGKTSQEFRKRYADHARSLLKMDVSEKDFLNSSRDDIQQLDRLNLIRSSFGLLSQMLDAQIAENKALHSEVNDVVMKTLDWNAAYYYFEYQVLYWWASHPNTSSEDIKALINKLEDEKGLFDLFRAKSLADYRYVMAAIDSEPNVYPQLRSRAFFPKELVPWISWEVARSKRNARSRLYQSWKTIDKLEGFHQTNEYGYAPYARYPLIAGDMVVKHMQSSGINSGFWNVGGVLFERRAFTIFLAIVLWQKEHEGELPESLAELKGSYLSKIPVSPHDGEPFFLAPKGLSSSQFRTSSHAWQVKGSWQLMGKYHQDWLDDWKRSPENRPFLWCNIPFRKDLTRSKMTGKIHSVEDFDDHSFESNLEVWIIPVFRSR